MGELPDPGVAEAICELLWADDIEAEPVCSRPSRWSMQTAVRIWAAGHAGEFPIPESPVWLAPREPALLAGLYLRIIDDISRAVPPQWEVLEDSGDTSEPRRLVLRCLGCSTSSGFRGPPAGFAESVMRKKHPLCGVRQRQREGERFGRQSVISFGP